MIVAPPSAKPVTVKEPVVLPLVILTDGGSTSTVPEGLEFKLILTPCGGAGAFKVNVPLIVWLRPTVLESSASETAGLITLTVAVTEANPVAEAVMVAEPTLPGVTGMPAVEPPAPITTLAGTLAMVGSLLNK